MRKAEKNKDFDTHHLLRWPVLRFRVRLDGAAADACKRLRTLATEQHGTVAIQTLISDAARTRS